jgi:hypothetical protein
MVVAILANAQIVPTTTVGEAYKSVAELDGISFAIVNTADGKALHGSNNQNLAYSEYSAAFSSGNTGYMWKLVSVPSDADEAIQGCYYLQLITPKGENYNCWGMGGYLNSQPATGGCSFILGLNNQHGQDGVNLAVYDIQYVEGQGFALKNIGTGMYQGYNTLPANSADPVYWTFAPVENSYVPALEALLAEGEAMKATVTNAYAAAVYTNAIAGIDPATTTDALADAKKVDAAITELAKAIPAEAGTDFTRAIVNPSFEAGSIEGWTESYGGNSANNGNFGAAAGSYFVERWQDKANGGLSDGSIMQTITGLPNGTYKLTAPMQNLEQYNSDAAGKGYLLVANGDSTEVAVSGETVEVTTEVTDGTLAIGAVLKGCTGNWVCVDNFQLTLVEYKSPAPVVKDAWYTDGAFAIVGHDFVDGVKNEFVEPRWIQDAAGEAYLEVTSNDNPSQEWDSQIFITLNDELKVGDKVNFSMLVRGTAEGVMSTQTHSAPGSYVGGLWSDINVTTEWTKYENVYTVSNATAKTLVFNLAKAATANNFQFDDIAISIEKAPEFEWVDIIKNGDMEGTDMSCFYKTEATVGPSIAAITAGAGKDGSAAIEIQSADAPAQDWDTQFFIRLPYVLPAGTHFLVEFDYKADKEGQADTQSHGEPGAYKHYACAGSPNFTTEWQTYKQEGTVANEADGMYTIAFNLAKNKVATKFVIDNVKFFVQDNVLPELTASPDLSKKEFSLDVERYPGMGYGPTTATADLAEALSFLGVEAATAEMLSIVNPDGTEVSDYATYDGWFAADGTAKTWGDLNAADAPAAGVCVKFFQALEGGQFDICDMNGADVVGTTYTVKYALKANDKTAIFSINVKFVEKPVLALTYADLTNKKDVAVEFTSELGKCYEGLTADVDVASILAELGAESLNDVTVYAVQSDGTLDDNYKLGTTDGWRNAEGDWQTWGADARICVKADFALESAQIYYVGGMDGQTAEPATYTATYAFVNANAEAVTLKVTLTYAVPDAIEGVEAATAANGKYMENGKLVIIKNGVKYNAAGQIVK